MAGAIDLLVRAAAEVLPSPVGASLNRSVTQRADYNSAPTRPLPGQPADRPTGPPAQEGPHHAANAERAPGAGLAKLTTLTFERDVDNGRMYLYIKEKRTGEEVLRIPSKILGTAERREESGHRVDVRI